MWFLNRILDGGWHMWAFGLLVVALFALTTWAVMLLEGALGNILNFRTLGYWESGVVAAAIWLLVMCSHKSPK